MDIGYHLKGLGGMGFCLADRSSLFNTRLVPWHRYNEIPQTRKAVVGHVDSC